jgi:hypothetical protein
MYPDVVERFESSLLGNLDMLIMCLDMWSSAVLLVPVPTISGMELPLINHY